MIVLAALLPTPRLAGAQTAGPTLFVAPRCAEAAPGDPIRMLILGLGWPSKPVALAAVTGEATTQLGTVDPRVSPVSQQPGSFTVVATVTAGTGGFRVTGTQGDLTRSASVGVDSSCGAGISVKPPCLGSPGPVQVTGTGFGPGESVEIDVDPFGDAEARPPAANADRTGTFTTTISLRVPRGPLPIIANFETDRAVAFVVACPTLPTSPPSTPPPTSPPPTPPQTPPPTPPATVPPTPPPTVPPVTVPGAQARVSISPQTVRPGRCAVLVFSGAPPASLVVARFADGPPVNAQIGPDGRAVTSVCVPHDAGNVLGPVAVLVSIGPFGPAPLFRVLRVPPRPQPPLLQAGADTRRS